MTISNKEVIDKLEAYFVEQDSRAIARAFAGMLLDIHRVVMIEQLPDGEAINLKNRMILNSQALMDFVKNGPQGEGFKCFNIPSGGN